MIVKYGTRKCTLCGEDDLGDKYYYTTGCAGREEAATTFSLYSNTLEVYEIFNSEIIWFLKNYIFEYIDKKSSSYQLTVDYLYLFTV